MRIFSIRLLICYLSILTLCVSDSLFAEIEWVKLSWRPESCPPNCYPVLERRLQRIPGVKALKMNFVDGEALLKWKPKVPYDDRSVRTAVAWVGLGLRNVHIKLRGLIEHDRHNTFIVSIGDETKLRLATPVKPEEGKYIVRGANLQQPLDPEMKLRLHKAEGEEEVVVIEGLLYQPYRPPIQLIIEEVSYANEWKI